MYINPSKPRGHYMYRQLNIHKFNVLPTQCICFVWIWEQIAITSPYSIKWLVFITETECAYCAVRTGYLYIIEVSYTICTTNLHTVSALHPHYAHAQSSICYRRHSHIHVPKTAVYFLHVNCAKGVLFVYLNNTRNFSAGQRCYNVFWTT
jgi:hypothetical protein